MLARTAKPQPTLPLGRAAATRARGQSPSQQSSSVGTESQTDTHQVTDAWLCCFGSKASGRQVSPLQSQFRTHVCAHLPQTPAIRHPSSNNAPNTLQGAALPSAAALQLIEQSDNLPCSSAAQGVAQGYCTPQGVHLLCRNPQLLHTVESLEGTRAVVKSPSALNCWPSQSHHNTQAHLTGKGLIDLKDVYVIHSQPCRQDLDQS